MDLTFPEGVHYLASESYKSGTTWGLNAIGVIFTICSIIGLIILIGSFIEYKRPEEIVVVLSGWIFVLFAVLAIVEYHSNPIYNTQYLVTVEQYVPYSVIQKDYKIINTKDNIVTLRPFTPVPWDENKESN